MTSLKTSIKTITYLSDIGCLEIQGASLDRECLYKTIVTVTGKGARLQEWIPVFLTVNILALLMSGYLQKSCITMTERG